MPRRGTGSVVVKGLVIYRHGDGVTIAGDTREATWIVEYVLLSDGKVKLKLMGKQDPIDADTVTKKA